MGMNSSIGDHAESQEEEECFHVLAVDDNRIDMKLLERLLKISSYHVTCVESGDKALKYLGVYDESSSDSNSLCYGAANCCSSSSSSLQQERSKVNLIMTDFSMPGMSGYDLLTRLKKSRWKDVPVVVMSSEHIPSRINMCLEGGAEEFLLKPLQLSDMNKIQIHLLKSSYQKFKNTVQDFNVNMANGNNNIATKRNKVVVSPSPQPSERIWNPTQIHGCTTL